jgi:hypothetical protein
MNPAPRWSTDSIFENLTWPVVAWLLRGLFFPR